MEKQELVQLIDNIFIPLGFKKKGNNWVKNTKEINKIINLQKSQYNNSFYINYGYIINNLPLNNWVKHVNDRLGSTNTEEQKLIIDLLNLENDISTSDRLILLHNIINKKIVTEMETIENEHDLVKNLNLREHLFTVAPSALKYLNIEFNW